MFFHVAPEFKQITRRTGWALLLGLASCGFSVRAVAATAPDLSGNEGSESQDLPPLVANSVTNAADTNLAAFTWELPVPNSTSSVPLVPSVSLEDALSVTSTNSPVRRSHIETITLLQKHLEEARYLRNTRRTSEAVPLLVSLLGDDSPQDIQQSALLELAAAVQEENDLPRAQQIYAQFLNRWPEDLRVPEILLRQGQLFRQMGLNNLALTKFYAVMTSALVLKNDRLDYYARLVLKAQVEIAETHYQLGKYNDAVDFFTRLLKQQNPALNQPQILYKLVRCYGMIGKYDDAVAYGQDFLARYPNAPEEPEVRFYLAVALKEIGRNNESLLQVLALLKEQSAQAREHPEVWAYWQQRTGNLIANQLYREGDYTRALDIYLNLARLDSSPNWQLPVWYQIGMTYERLWQPQKAIETYTNIIHREKDLGENAPPNLKTVVDMARWRISFIQWENKAEAANRSLQQTNSISTTAGLLSANTPTQTPDATKP